MTRQLVIESRFECEHSHYLIAKDVCTQSTLEYFPPANEPLLCTLKSTRARQLVIAEYITNSWIHQDNTTITQVFIVAQYVWSVRNPLAYSRKTASSSSFCPRQTL